MGHDYEEWTRKELPPLSHQPDLFGGQPWAQTTAVPGEFKFRPSDVPKVAKRVFETGALRDTAEGKLAYHGFIGWHAMRLFAEYMHENRKMADGSMRDSNNWKRGIPVASYEDSLVRHVVEFATRIEDGDRSEATMKIACAIMFNVQGWLEEWARKER